MEKLKPCPMCGGDKAEIGIIGGATFWVECSACGACSASHDDEYDAIAAWNTRPGEDALQERIDALEWMIECDNFNIGRCKNADAAHECIATREAAHSAVEKK